MSIMMDEMSSIGIDVSELKKSEKMKMLQKWFDTPRPEFSMDCPTEPDRNRLYGFLRPFDLYIWFLAIVVSFILHKLSIFSIIIIAVFYIFKKRIIKLFAKTKLNDSGYGKVKAVYDIKLAQYNVELDEFNAKELKPYCSKLIKENQINDLLMEFAIEGNRNILDVNFGIDESELVSDPCILFLPVYDEENEDDEQLKYTEDDKEYYKKYYVQIVNVTQHDLVSYECEFDFYNGKMARPKNKVHYQIADILTINERTLDGRVGNYQSIEFKNKDVVIIPAGQLSVKNLYEIEINKFSDIPSSMSAGDRLKLISDRDNLEKICLEGEFTYEEVQELKIKLQENGVIDHEIISVEDELTELQEQNFDSAMKIAGVIRRLWREANMK